MADFSFSSGATGGDGGNPVVAGGDAGDLGATDVFGTIFDPAIHSGADKLNADGSFRKKRGRRAGSGTTTGTSSGSGNRSKASLSASVDALTRALAIVHAGLASVTKSPELMLTEDEAKTLANASVNVLQHFDITPDPKTEAIVALVMCGATIYGTKIYNINERKKKEREEEENKPGVVGLPGFARAS